MEAVNQAACDFLQLRPHQIENYPVFGIFPPARRPEVKAFLNRIMMYGVRSEQRLTIRCYVGEELVDSELQARCIGEDGDAVLLLQLADFREHAELHTERILIEEAFAHTLEPTFIADRADEPRVLFRNNSLLEFFGLDEVSPGQTLRSVFASSIRGSRLERVIEAVKSPEAGSCVFPIDSPGGTRWYACQVKQIDTNTGFSGVVCSIQPLEQNDSTRAEGERYRLLGMVAGGVAHDFSNLITVANTLISNGRHEAQDNAALVEVFNDLDAIMSHTDALAAQLTSIMRNQSSGDEQCDPLVAVALVQSVLRHIARSKRLIVELGSSSKTLAMPAINLWQILFNLVSNAADFATSQIRLGVEQIALTSRPEYFSLLTIEANTALHIKVEDDGPGVAPELAGTLFAPTVSSREGGNGLGLATVEWIVKKHHGAVWFEDVKEGGARFHVVIPFQDDASQD